MYRQSEKKLVKQKYLLQMSSQYGELLPTNGWDRFTILGHPVNFNWFRVLALLLQQRRSPEANQTLHDLWSSPGLVHYVYIFLGLLPPGGILPRAEFTLHPSLAFSYIGSITAWHSSSGPEPKFMALYKEWNYGTFTEGATYIRLGGHDVGHGPTF